MTKPQISDFKNPRDYVAACEKYAASLAPAERADSADDTEGEDRPAGAPRMADFTDPRKYADACEAFARGVLRQDSSACTDATLYRTSRVESGGGVSDG